MTDAVRNGNAFFGANSANSVNPALSAVANAQKTASPAENKTQDFGAVLDKTVQKYEQKPTQPVSDSSTGTQTQQPGKETIQAEGENDNAIKDTDTAVDAVESDVADTQETVESDVPAVTEEPAGETVRIEEPVDQMTIDEITKALEQIIEQIKQILGITDDELLSGMDALGMQAYDLLNADNMAQLVTAISGEDSTVSLIANEELYTALQEITQTVDTQVGSLLENTGFTSEELDAVLQKLQEMESQELDDQLQDMEMLSPETTEEPAVDGQQEPEGPVIISEDNTRADEQPAKQYDKLPENQQDNPVEIGAKPQTQSAGKDTKGSDDKESGNFGQNNAAQNFRNNLSEAGAAAEGVEKFTSESTENIMRQLADMVKIVKNENLTEMELQLHPASLGTVNVSLTTKGGMVTAEFTTQNEAVKAAIEAQATQLRANLEEQGVKVEAIEVSVESEISTRTVRSSRGRRRSRRRCVSRECAEAGAASISGHLPTGRNWRVRCREQMTRQGLRWRSWQRTETRWIYWYKEKEKGERWTHGRYIGTSRREW